MSSSGFALSSLTLTNGPRYQSTPTTLTILSALLGIVLPDIGGLIGLSCDPITVIGTGSGSTCTEQTVCCTDNDFVSREPWM